MTCELTLDLWSLPATHTVSGAAGGITHFGTGHP
jgi:hypothetical protein